MWTLQNNFFFCLQNMALKVLQYFSHTLHISDVKSNSKQSLCLMVSHLSSPEAVFKQTPSSKQATGSPLVLKNFPFLFLASSMNFFSEFPIQKLLLSINSMTLCALSGMRCNGCWHKAGDSRDTKWFAV